jgi:hypothetical protein
MEITKTSFETARDYLMSNGRPLERALFCYHFEDESVEAVLCELELFYRGLATASNCAVRG